MRESKRVVVAALFCFALPAAAHALEVKSLASPKGEEVWYVSDHTLPMIALTAALPAGSAYDPPGKPGLANFAAELLDEGAGSLNATAFQTALSNRAIRLSVSPDRDYLIVSIVTLAGNAKDAFQLLGLALARPRFDSDAIGRARAQILATLSEQDEEPDFVAEKGFFQAYFQNHPYAHPLAGNPASVASTGAADLRRFAASHWVSRGLKVAVSGDVDEDTLAALLRSAFGDLPNRAPASPPPPVLHTGQPGASTIEMSALQSSAVFGLPGMLRSDPDYISGFVANYILGGDGSSSRLTTELREKRGLTYDVSTSLELYRKAGFVLGEVATRRGAMKETLAVVRAALRDFAATGPTDKELADAKTYLTGSYPLSFSANVGTADQLNVLQRLGLPVEYVQRRNGLINAVTLDQVKRAANCLFNPSKLTVVVAGSLGAAASAGHQGATAASATH